jgi:hypothetical protein
LLCADVSFQALFRTHVETHRDQSSGQRVNVVVLDESHTRYDVNEGQGLDGTHPNFTAPENGTHFFIATDYVESTNLTFQELTTMPLRLVKV